MFALETSWRRLQDMSSRRLEDQQMFAGVNHWSRQKSAVRRCFSKQLVLQMLQYWQENTCVGVSFLKSCLFLKKRLQLRCFLWILWNSINSFFIETSDGCFWKSYHNTVKSAWIFFLWIYAFTCFRIWLKTYAKRCTINSLLSRDKTISFFLELTYHVLSISEYVLEKYYLRSILMKNLHKAFRK